MVAFCCNQLNAQQGSLFTFLPPSETHVTFANPVVETKDYNINVFIYAYNGAGVAVGDVNGNAPPNLFFGSSQGSCKLYLNRGNFRFEDVTHSAGVADSTGVHFGVSMVDIDGDKDLDIYLSKERRYECSFSSGYLSQCSGAILVSPTATQATLFRGSKLLKTIIFTNESGITGRATTQ